MTIIDDVQVELDPEELKKAERMLGRKPNAVEAGMIDVMWSEHCSYKSSRPVLKLLPQKGPRVVCGPGQDAGAVDIGDNYVVVFKIESHNHPSAIEPYNGAATGIGGIIRDILCMGARPIALLDPLRFGSLKSPHSRWLFKYVVKGIADYGNCVGIPTVGGEVEFDESFESNCLVNVACVGVAKRDEIVLSEAKYPGDVVILAGGSTGRDGIHGVTFASRALTEESEEDRPAVQVGDPFTKKLIIDATLEILKTGFVHGLKDLGGGGLTCASSEMASKGGTGIDIELSKVHLREKGLRVVVQRERLGTGHAVMVTEEIFKNFDGDVFILCGDVPLLRYKTLEKIQERHRKLNASCTVLTAFMDDALKYGRIVRNTDNNVQRIVEFKDATVEEKEIKEINTGIYCFDAKDLFTALQSIDSNNNQNEYYLTDTLEILNNENKLVTSVILDDMVEASGVNSKEQLADLETEFLTRQEHFER